ncbi:Sterol uptake control 2 [Hyphodiscus hymeniophilus]|uniref:Sterol uptake control 2 n=1 Tax=Hyphodiscus hymeniophilus TaxID=353542 RepID=A0A9P6VJ78_9HELO|nr:Sterol uptake control 2 [Hyphodiscus hymeniophilus]
MPHPRPPPEPRHTAQASAPPSTSRPAVYKPRISRNFPRSRNGCLTCKSRKKKCDETHPVCGCCAKKNLDCSWPESKAQKEGARHHVAAQLRLKPGELNKSQVSSYSLMGSSSSLLCHQWSLSYSREFLNNPNSRLLFDRYLSRTSVQLGIISPKGNPFIHCVLPLAFSDKLVMNCILALAGVEYGEEIPAVTVPTIWKHYSLVLRDLKASVSQGMQEEKRLHLLLVTIFLAIFESISGNSQTSLHHLKASRQLVLSISSNPSSLLTQEHRDVWGFLLEMYSYRALIASITPLGAVESQPIIVDPFLNSLSTLTQYKTYGFQFSFGYSLFQFIPEVSQITNQRMAEENSGTFSASTYMSYMSLRSRLSSWNSCILAEETNIGSQNIVAATIYQNSLLIYLYSYFCDSDPGTLLEMELLANRAFPLLISLSQSQVASIMMWPTLMVSSCLRQEEQYDMVREGISHVDFNSKTVKQCLELLNLLWADSDLRAYGPRGLDLIMKKKGWSLYMS